MKTAVAPERASHHPETEQPTVLRLHLADTTPRGSDTPSFDPTQGRKIGSDPYDDPTQGRKIGSHPYDDPTRAHPLVRM
jgi:hypothetical protein